MHGAGTTATGLGTVVVNTSTGVTVENNTFAWNAASGFEIGQGSDNLVATGNTMVDNGLSGATSWGNPRNLQFQGNYVAANNQERFSVWWAAAGLKFNGIVSSTVKDNTVEDNYATGIWCDNGCSGVNIVSNLVRRNSLYGIMYEISDSAVIGSNLVVNNASLGAGGVYVSESTNVKVFNNTIANNSVQDARAIDVNAGSRVKTTGVVIENNVVSHSNSSTKWALRVQDDTNSVGAASMISALDYNGYYRRSSSSPTAQARWGASGQVVNYATLAQFQSATQKEAHGLAVDNQTTSPFFVDEANGDYHLKSGSVAVGRGAPLPADVASAMGVGAGAPVDLGVLVWPSSAATTQSTTSTTSTTSAPTTSTTAPTSTTSSTSTTSTTVATPPTVTISSPANGAKVAKKQAIKGSAKGSSSIKSMVITIDGKQMATSTSSSVSYTWATSPVAAGTHTITVKATDAKGLSGSATVTVYK